MSWISLTLCIPCSNAHWWIPRFFSASTVGLSMEEPQKSFLSRTRTPLPLLIPTLAIPRPNVSPRPQVPNSTLTGSPRASLSNIDTGVPRPSTGSLMVQQNATMLTTSFQARETLNACQTSPPTGNHETQLNAPEPSSSFCFCFKVYFFSKSKNKHRERGKQTEFTRTGSFLKDQNSQC